MYAPQTKTGLFELADHLPGEAAEALLELAVGGTPKPMLPVYGSRPTDQLALGVRDGEPDVPTGQIAGSGPFEHPDATRRFRYCARRRRIGACP